MGRILNFLLQHSAVGSSLGAAGALMDWPMPLIAVICGCNCNS